MIEYAILLSTHSVKNEHQTHAFPAPSKFSYERTGPTRNDGNPP